MSRLLEYRRLFGTCPPLAMKIEETPTLAELDGLVAECGARGQELSQAERNAVAVRRAELGRKSR